MRGVGVHGAGRAGPHPEALTARPLSPGHCWGSPHVSDSDSGGRRVAGGQALAKMLSRLVSCFPC